MRPVGSSGAEAGAGEAGWGWGPSRAAGRHRPQMHGGTGSASSRPHWRGACPGWVGSRPGPPPCASGGSTTPEQLARPFHSALPHPRRRSQLPRPSASPAPGRAEGHFSPGRSWRPLPPPAGLSPPGRGPPMGVARRWPPPPACSPAPRFQRQPRAQPPVSPLRGGPCSAPSSIITRTHGHPATLAFLHPLRPPSPQFTAEMRTHTLMHKTNCGMSPCF